MVDDATQVQVQREYKREEYYVYMYMRSSRYWAPLCIVVVGRYQAPLSRRLASDNSSIIGHVVNFQHTHVHCIHLSAGGVAFGRASGVALATWQ